MPMSEQKFVGEAVRQLRQYLARQGVAFGLLFARSQAGDAFVIVPEEMPSEHKIELLRDALDAIQKALTLETTSSPHKVQ